MAKKYDILEEKPCMVSEPAMAYRINEQKALKMVKSVIVPCTFTDEEFKEELRLSEASGFISDDEFKISCLEKWGVAL